MHISLKNKSRKVYYILLTYLAITTGYKSWPQLVYDAIHHALLQFCANFGYPALLHSQSYVWNNAGEAVLVCDFHHLAQIRRLEELGWRYPYKWHDPAIEGAVFEYASLHRCHRIYPTAPGSIVCAILLYIKNEHTFYVGFSSRERLRGLFDKYPSLSTDGTTH